MSGAPLRLACIDADAPPLFAKMTADGVRAGYEPAAAALVAGVLGRRLEWACMPWNDMIGSAQRHEVEGVWCGQGITAARRQQVDFTRPYAVFDESVLVRRGSGITGPDQLRGLRVGAIAGSTNMTLALTFEGAVPVPFGGRSDDVFAEMLDALRAREVDGVVDDDVALVPLGDHPDFETAFTVPTGNRWGIGVAKDRPDVLAALDAALAEVIADGRLEATWREQMPTLPFPAALRDGRPSIG